MQRHQDENLYSQAKIQYHQQNGLSVYQNQISQNQQIVYSKQKNNSQSRILVDTPISDILNIQVNEFSQRTPQDQFGQIKSQKQAQLNFSKSQVEGENFNRESLLNAQTNNITQKQIQYKQNIKVNDVKKRILFLSPVVQGCLESELCLEHFDFTDLIYQGPIRGVYKCYHKTTGKCYAIKVISKYISEYAKYIINEAKMLYELNHPNIIKLLNHFEDDNYIYFVFKYYKLGTLAEYMNTIDKLQINQYASKFVMQIAFGLKYLHDLNIIHRDLKPENILIDDNGNIKICDFGLSTYFDGKPRKSQCGTFFYMAPEINHIIDGYNTKVDIWSLGIIIYCLFTGKPYYQDSNYLDESQILNLYKKNQYLDILENSFDDSEINSLASMLMKQMLQRDPNSRPNAQQIINSVWIIVYQSQYKNNYKDYVDNQMQELELLTEGKKIVYSSSQIQYFLNQRCQ